MAGVSAATQDDKEGEAAVEKQRQKAKEEEILAAERVKKQKRAIERKIREQEQEEERKQKEWEEQVKRAAEAEKEKHKEERTHTEKVRFELPATGKIGRTTLAKQQQKLQEKTRQQQKAKEQEESKQKGKLQFSFGKAPLAFKSSSDKADSQGVRIDASTFLKKLNEEKQRNQIEDKSVEPASLDKFLSVGDTSLPVVAETRPEQSSTQPRESTAKRNTPSKRKHPDQDEDLKLLGIDPDSTSVMDISNRPPQLAGRKPSTETGACGAATSVSGLYNVLNPSHAGPPGEQGKENGTASFERHPF